ncbi:MAG: DUF4365 domain-containing protein [Clostridiaceae bacterium]|nr:DUF4365 domain-containing protein [Clostridiaceae bacterium]
MLPINKIKEEISRAFVSLITARSGYVVEYLGHDFGIDGTIRELIKLPNGDVRPGYGPSIDFQLKSTENYIIENDNIVYDLEAKNYNDLVVNSANPRILILYLLPREQDRWVKILGKDANTFTLMMHSAWWHSLRNEEPTHNTSKVRIRIPLSQRFELNTIRNMFYNINQGNAL